MKHARRAALAALTLTLLTACGGSDHNDADVTFAQQMIPHHRQALMMTRLAATHDAGAEVRDLAQRIEKAQEPEIEQMTSWLEDWDEGRGHGMDHDDMGGMGDGSDGDIGGQPGMMDPGDMQDLAAARGAEFDRLFLTQMIEHHQGAVEMARTEQADGKSTDAVDLAERIEDSQTAEIAEMRQLLG